MSHGRLAGDAAHASHPAAISGVAGKLRRFWLFRSPVRPGSRGCAARSTEAWTNARHARLNAVGCRRRRNLARGRKSRRRRRSAPQRRRETRDDLHRTVFSGSRVSPGVTACSVHGHVRQYSRPSFAVKRRRRQCEYLQSRRNTECEGGGSRCSGIGAALTGGEVGFQRV